MKIALIGGAGFIGHHLALRLAREGHDVLVADFLVVNHLGPHLERRGEAWGQRYLDMLGERLALMHDAGVIYRHTDARDYHRLSRCLSTFEPDAVVHLAAVAHITVTRLDQHLAWEHSILTLKNALDVACAIGRPHFVYLSSSTVYGNFKRPVVTEEDKPEPDNTYGAFKWIGEHMIHAWHRDQRVPYTIIRPQALYGPRCVSRRVTQVFLENAFDGKPLRIDGDGSAMHDFTHVDDLVAGIQAVLELPDASVGETFCMTAGKAYSLAQLAGFVQEQIPGTHIEHGPADPQKPSRGTMSTAKARKLLGWTPRIDLPEGIARYANWYRELLHAAQARDVA